MIKLILCFSVFLLSILGCYFIIVNACFSTNKSLPQYSCSPSMGVSIQVMEHTFQCDCEGEEVRINILRPFCYGMNNDTVDREIFTLKIIHMKFFVLLKFSRFHSICEMF